LSARSLILIGMPASGKTSVARETARLLGREHIDSDSLIESAEGRTCGEILNTNGEEYFRQVEREALIRAFGQRNAVISLGGGAPVRNTALIRASGVVVWLERDLNDCAGSLDHSSRPLSTRREDLLRLYEERRDVYMKCADFTAENTGTIRDAAREIAGKARVLLRERILVVNGPNLNMLGVREPAVYGSRSEWDLVRFAQDAGRERGVDIVFFQSNSEGEIVGAIQQAAGKFDGIVINPGAYTHYSYAILDALKAVPVPAVEVHLSDIGSREEFRRHSVVRDGCVAQVTGRGFDGYGDAIGLLHERIRSDG